MEITWRVISREGEGENGEKVQGLRSLNGRYKIYRGDGKNNMGNGESKELMTHGHDLRWGECWWKGEGQEEGG